MSRCVVEHWRRGLDKEDKAAFRRAIKSQRTKANLYQLICEAEGAKPFGLTALKQHINRRCVCY